MRYPKPLATRSHLKTLAALLLATALGGCVGYAGYPSSGYGHNYPNNYSNDYYRGYPSTYSYNHPSNYYAGYPRAQSTSYGDRPYYSPYYGGYNNAYETRGGGN
jgi:hypothetical protein